MPLIWLFGELPLQKQDQFIAKDAPPKKNCINMISLLQLLSQMRSPLILQLQTLPNASE